MESTKLDVKHRIVLPAHARRALGLRAGDGYAFDIVGGKVFLRRVADRGRGDA